MKTTRRANATRAQEGQLKLSDERQSLKHKENWRKLLLLGIQPGDKLAKPPFFVAYSRLCRHCRNLAEGGCRLSRFHFRLCRYFLGHVACRNLPWQGLTTHIWVVTSHQYGISTLVLWRHLPGASRNVSCFLRLSWSPTSGKATREARINDAKVRWLLITVWTHLLTRWERRQTPF